MSDIPLPGYENYEEPLLDWTKAAINEGDRILRADPLYPEIENAISYIMGDQINQHRPATLANIYDNRTKRIILQQVAALTDFQSLFGFKTLNPQFEAQSEVLNNLVTAWWTNSMADMKLADVLRYAAGPGTGYCEVHWNPNAGNGVGDISLIPRDPRDVLPIRPTLGTSLQEWEGVIIRSAEPVTKLQARFPEKAHRIRPTNPSGIPDRTWGSAQRWMRQTISPAVDSLTDKPRNVPSAVKTANLYYIYFRDRRLHTGSDPMVMGDPQTSWSYTVYPAGSVDAEGRKRDREETMLYPRGRLIICTDDCILFDGPNPYWHGMFPIASLRLDPWPWGLLGVGITRDIMPLQDALNETANGILDMVRKALRPGVKGDARAMPESLWNRMDTRIPGHKIRHNPLLGGIEYEPPPNIPPYVFDFLKMMVEEMDYHGGVANLQALTAMKQAPGSDTLEQMMEALSPTLRLKARLLEGFLREIGEMVKVNFFQFYNLPRRVAILGDQGIDMEDFQFDPGSLVPALSPAADGDLYDPQLDFKLPRAARARYHHRQFAFQITPNSLLAISQISRKMMYLRLYREGLMDPWTLYETLEIPNAGNPPSGSKLITDRLNDAAMMGIGPMAMPGPKPTGQEPPSMDQKPDASGIPRVAVSESG